LRKVAPLLYNLFRSFAAEVLLLLLPSPSRNQSGNLSSAHIAFVPLDELEIKILFTRNESWWVELGNVGKVPTSQYRSSNFRLNTVYQLFAIEFLLYRYKKGTNLSSAPLHSKSEHYKKN